MERVLSETESVCPVCLERISAKKVLRNGDVYLEKSCPQDGFFSVRIWGSQVDYVSWNQKKHRKSAVNALRNPSEGCPYDCGLCTEHRQRTCCVLLEVTARCNLGCPICFASAGFAKRDISLAEIKERLEQLMNCGGPYNIQLSGGEPTMRDDLPEIIRIGRSIGFTFFQLNTNGIRIAEDPEYAKALQEAGLNCVFLQFDGLKETTYKTIRGKELFHIKERAIKVCKELSIGVVLVPTLVESVNMDEIGDILGFAIQHMPEVRGVHFQPISYFGRYEGEPPKERVTLSDLLYEIEVQTKGLMKINHFTPGNAENPYCSFSGNFMKSKDGNLKAWQEENSCCCNGGSEAGIDSSDKAREFVARQWSGVKENARVADSCLIGESLSIDQYLERLQTHSLAVSAMAFMDAYTLDLERLKECYIHVATKTAAKHNESFRMIPFCAYNLSSLEGETLYRGSGGYE